MNLGTDSSSLVAAIHISLSASAVDGSILARDRKTPSPSAVAVAVSALDSLLAGKLNS